MSLRKLFTIVSLSLVITYPQLSAAATDAELKNRKREVERLYATYQSHNDEYEKHVSKRMIVENKIEAIEKAISQHESELAQYDGLSLSAMTSEILNALQGIKRKIETKESELERANQQKIQMENDAQNVNVRVETSEKRFRAANRSLNKLIDQVIETKTHSEIESFEKPVKVSKGAKVTCSRSETPDQCEQRGYAKATKQIQDSKQLITSSSVVRDFELESDLVERYSNNQLSDVRQTLVETDYNRELRSEILTVEVSAMVSAQANNVLIDKFKDKIGLLYSQYRFVEGTPLTIDEQVNNAIKAQKTSPEPQPVSNNINVVLDTLFTQGLRLVNLEAFEGESQSAFAVLKEMASININHDRTQLLATMMDSAVAIKAKEYVISGKAGNGVSLVTNYQALQSELGLAASAWIPEYLAASSGSLNATAAVESAKIEQAKKQVKKLSSRDIKKLLSSARYLIRKDKYFAPASSNAYDKVKLVLDQQPSNSKANTYYDKIFEDAAEDAVDLAEDGEFAQARSLLQSGLDKVAGESRLKRAMDKVNELESAPKKKVRRIVGGF